ncbi:aspartate aminotransferase family protein [Mycolicibacterium sp. P9-22]|uniref:aspartate aminotransferase family protein n=1 Tax=Mycolicibacterium sp. P9-22 TaxID=2024613 RepID=UPI00188352AE|nr:aminotransferase class III-fold pyridoxal phosphate-dependent enzyme [Mycolicibacterium sp. P9-22]
MAVRGEGCYIEDDGGYRLIDVNNNFTALIHGHAHPVVHDAAQCAMRDGMAFGLPNMLEIEHAQLMMDRLRYVDQIRYTNSGTEAVMLAVRVARTVTGRDGVIFVRKAYHGHSDIALVPGGANSRRGVPAGVVEDTVEVSINDIGELTAAFDRLDGKIAAVMIDPMPNRAGLVTVDPEFWQAARALCDRTGALLISDEVIGLRLAYAGAAMSMGVVPDLIVMGKIIGGGTPVGALAGRADVMAALDPLDGGLEHGGTYSGNPVTMAAGLAAMRLYDGAAVKRLNGLGERLRSTLTGIVTAHGWHVRGGGSLFRPYPGHLTPEETRAAHTTLWWAAYDRGVLMTQSCQGALSTPMTEAIVDDVAERIGDAVVATASSG